MARRRDYVSFFSDGRGRRRDLPGFRRGTRLSALLLPALALIILAVSVWWYAIRDTRDDPAETVTLEDASIPSVLFPTDDAAEEPGAADVIACTEPAPTWSTFQGTPARTGCTDAPTIVTPRIIWRAHVGVQGWLNNPIIVGDTIIVGSAGTAQFQRDNSDGIYALDLATGLQKWFFGAELDVNGVGYGDGMIIGTGDEGRVWGLDINGNLQWTDDLEAPTFGNPLTVGGIVVIGDGRGRVTAYDIRTGNQRWQQQVSGPVRGGAASNGDVIVVTGEHREVLAVDLDGRELWRVEVRSRAPSAEETRLFSAPTIVDDLVIIGLLRGDDTYIDPAMVALHISDGRVIWEASDTAGIKSEWGNVRSSPAVVGGLLLYGEPYGDSLVAIDVANGETQWAVAAGAFCYPHWPSPAVVGDQVILPRHDGGVYAVSLPTQEVAWGIFVGSSESTGAFPDGYPENFCEWQPEAAFSVLSSPAVGPDGTIVVGTLEGYLFAIADRDW